jgi:hypothetical protein
MRNEMSASQEQMRTSCQQTQIPKGGRYGITFYYILSLIEIVHGMDM